MFYCSTLFFIRFWALGVAQLASHAQSPSEGGRGGHDPGHEGTQLVMTLVTTPPSQARVGHEKMGHVFWHDRPQVVTPPVTPFAHLPSVAGTTRAQAVTTS